MPLPAAEDYAVDGERGSGGGHGRGSAGFLEMCTETLGCENGVRCSGYDMEASAAKERSSPEALKMGRRRQGRAAAAAQAFPPPLTTLGGEGRLRLQRKREEGRLLLLPFRPSLLEAERSGGRLQLRLLPGETAAKEIVVEELPEIDEDGRFSVVRGGVRKYGRARRCVEVQGGESGRKKAAAAAAADIFNLDSFWVASS